MRGKLHAAALKALAPAGAETETHTPRDAKDWNVQVQLDAKREAQARADAQADDELVHALAHGIHPH